MNLSRTIAENQRFAYKTKSVKIPYFAIEIRVIFTPSDKRVHVRLEKSQTPRQLNQTLPGTTYSSAEFGVITQLCCSMRVSITTSGARARASREIFPFTFLPSSE